MAWQPNPQGLQEIVNLFLVSRQATNEQHRQIQEKIVEFNRNPEFNCYLVHIFACLSSAQIEAGEAVRQRAGLLLKNNVKQFWESFPPQVVSTIQEHVVKSITDESEFIRRTTCSVLSTIVAHEKFALETWPALMPTLINALDSANPLAVHGAFNALVMISEDVPERLDADYDGVGRPVNAIVLKSLAFFKHSDEKLRRCAVSCISNVLQLMPAVLSANMDSYLQGISSLASDPSPAIRRLVCDAICTLMEVRYDVLEPHLSQISEFMLSATLDDEGEVALSAANYWNNFCIVLADAEELQEEVAGRAVLQALLPRLIPVLLQRMVFDEDEIAELEAAAEEDAHVQDRPEDIGPIFHKKEGGASEAGEGGEGAQSDGDDADDDEVLQWTLRKCAANGLDSIAHCFGDEILPLLLPALQERLSAPGQEHWVTRESAILALGAISDGCYDGICEHLPQLFPFLLSLLRDPVPPIRSISCWALGRYAHWAVQDSEPNQQPRLQPLVGALLECVRDRNKKVQEAACSAFATLTETAGDALCPYLVQILQVLMAAYREYQIKNLLMLYDAIGTLAEAVRGTAEVQDPACTALLMPPLIEKWHTVADDDRQIFPLFECLASVAQALGGNFLEFAPPVWTRALTVIQAVLVSHATAGADDEPLDKEFAICALDLLDGVADALGADAARPDLAAHPSLLPMLVETAKDPVDDMRQSTFALIGDLCESCPDCVRAAHEQLVPLLVQNIIPEALADQYNLSVANNATWALGLFALALGDHMRPYAAAAVAPMLAMLGADGGDPNPSLSENAVIAVGRVSGVCADATAPLLEGGRIAHFCTNLKLVQDAQEKDHAYRGLCAVVQHTPALCSQPPTFVALCTAIADYADGDGGEDNTHDLFRGLLASYKTAFTAQWPQIWQLLPPTLQQHLVARYQV